MNKQQWQTHWGIHRVRACGEIPDNPTEWLASMAGNPIWWLFSSWGTKPRSGATERHSLRKYWFAIPSDTITSCILVSSCTKTKIRVAFSFPFHHPSSYPGWWWAKVTKAEWHNCYRICAKDACNTIDQVEHRQVSCERTANDEGKVPS